MPFARPTLTALRNIAVQDITTSGIPGLDGLLRNAVLRVLAWVMAGLAYAEYGYLDWIAREAVPFTATDEYLDAWAALIGVSRKDAAPASGTAQFNGQPNILLGAGANLRRQDGTPYTSSANVQSDSAGILLVPFVAAVDGAFTNCDAGSAISLNDAPSGMNAGGVTVGPTTGGADMETDEEFRSRMLAKYRDPPQGGAAGDYVTWALEVPGCTRAWAQPYGMGPGSVVVRVMFDDAQAIHGGFPQGIDGVATDEPRGEITATGDQLTVANHIFPVQPVTALVYVMAPAPWPIDVELLALDPDTPDIEAAIIASLVDMFLAKGETGGTIFPSDLYEAILATPGVNRFTMAAPAGPITADAGALPILGTFTVTNTAP
jgi:uncharacterized phage protein gp47/JayE